MKAKIFLLFLLVSLLVFPVLSFAEEQTTIEYPKIQVGFFNSTFDPNAGTSLLDNISLYGEEMYVVNGKTVIPLDSIPQIFGYTYSVELENKKEITEEIDNIKAIYLEKNEEKIELTSNEEQLIKNQLTLINQKIYLPLTTVTKALGYSVHLYSYRTTPIVVIDQNNIISNEYFNQLASQEFNQSIVNPYRSYGYVEMQQDLQKLKKKYPFIQTEVIGKSVEGRDLVVVKLGKGPKEVYYSGAIHAEEWINGPVLMKFIEDYAKAYTNWDSIQNYYIRGLFDTTTIYIQPICNPDGVELALRGIDPANPHYYNVMTMNNWSTNFSNWRSNINGVNLNSNFPANWERVRDQYEKVPSKYQFPGYAPLTEPESIAMYNFTLNHNFRLVYALHSQGKIIFWKYYGYEPAESVAIVKTLSKLSGYAPYVPVRSDGGYRDWFVQQYGRPGFTIEVGIGRNPLPISQFGSIWNSVLPMLLYGAVV